MLAQGREPACLQPAIRGKIADLLDCPVVSARVVLSGTKLEDKLSSVTGERGIFMFCRIPPGSYTLEVTCNGFNKLVQRGISVRDRTITGLDLKMDFLEDSRTINLRAMSLEYFNDTPPPTDSLPSGLPRHLSEVAAELSLARALFNPPAALEVGRAITIELGVYQNLIGEVMHRLLARNVCCVDRERLGITLAAQLQIDGCEVLPRRAPRAVIDRARYLDWAWEVIPKTPGTGLIRLRLEATIRFAEHGEREKCLLLIDREVGIRKTRWLALRRWFRKKHSKQTDDESFNRGG
ncbi:MAG: carboxypeptidase-like regulatory domain-containing protein [Candidatus Aminicenantes bacterium]|nr:carboxypeptidase-like regulatory domain-containing protein [Candidatus Aminicenantes bacterium]